MKLTQMKRSASGKNVVYRAPAVDRRGQSHYEVSVEGPKALVEKTLGEADFKIDIDPDATEQVMHKRVAELLEPFRREQAKRAMDPRRLAAERPAAKEPAPGPRTVTVAIRPTAEHRTFWLFDTFIPVPVPPLFQVVFPPCFVGGMASFPIAGNPNVRIRFNSPFPPNVAASALGGLAIDTASYSLPFWAPVFPFYQWPVATAPAVARLMCWGYGLFP